MNPFVFALLTGLITGECSFFLEAVNQSVINPFEGIQLITVKLKKITGFIFCF